GRLVLEGFVERHGGYTTRVARFPEDEIEQVYELRRLIETYAARRAARFASAADIDALWRIHAEMAADTPPADEAAQHRLIEANEAFHRRVALAARSPRLMALMTSVFDMGMVARTYRKFDATDLERSLRHHSELITAIEARAPDWAEALMSAHLLAGAARVSAATQD
ncbi:MAG: FCD domain-containing protein, partial [Pseudomonadota bacterium]